MKLSDLDSNEEGNEVVDNKIKSSKSNYLNYLRNRSSLMLVKELVISEYTKQKLPALPVTEVLVSAMNFMPTTPPLVSIKS